MHTQLIQEAVSATAAPVQGTPLYESVGFPHRNAADAKRGYFILKTADTSTTADATY